MAIYKLTELHLGHPQIDRDHQQLFKMLLKLEQLQRSDASLDQITAHFRVLLAATRQHFNDEEVKMQETGYSGTDDHMRAHEALIAQLQSLHVATEAAVIDVGPGTIDFLYAWFYDHIASVDRPFVDYLKAKETDPSARRLERGEKAAPCV